ncbi:MAG: hypothetical protein L3J69_04370 [Desulfobacula sp.]|nr:hypothetical protein [Desulfobacula sp.]
MIILIVLITLVAVIVGSLYFRKQRDNQTFVPVQKTMAALSGTDNGADKIKTQDGVAQGDIIVMPNIDYKHLTKDKKLKSLMGSRKQKLGLDKSLDMIVNSDESFTIGDIEISMSDILKKAFLKEGEVFEEKIEHSGEIRPRKIKEYGIYVIQAGDNIWNIHFNILKEFYDNRDIDVSPQADEPGNQGLSSGVGKILKFSETIVIIYNLIEKKIDTNLDLLEPLSKIVVYNMDEVFSLLTEINYKNIDRIQFDGKSIWIPAEK